MTRDQLLWMKLHREREWVVLAFHSLDHAVGRPGHRDESGRHILDRLMVQAVRIEASTTQDFS